jgi:hemolysin activation/secretion protein
VENSSTPVEYSPLSVRYDGNWKHDQGVTSFNIEANALFRGMGNDQRQFTTKRPLPTSDESVRPGGRTNYFYLGARLEHRQNLPYDIQAVALMDGQVATDMLINNEQFTAGGMGSVRGYHQVEILGDHGVSGSLELYSPKLALNDWDFVQELRALTFVDAARTSIIKPLNLQPDHYDLVSTGVGLKWQFWKHLIGEFYWAYPFTRTQNVNPGTQRIDFRLLLDY